MPYLIVDLLGEYMPLNGEGIASLNLVWIVGAIFFLMTMWFLYKILLLIFRGKK